MKAIVTGASSGIGEAVARELTRRGYAVVLLARRREMLERVAADLPGSVPVPCDVTDAAAVRDAVRRNGPFDVAVANAGIGATGWAAKSVADAELMMRVNYFGMLHLFEAVIPAMMERRSGRFAGIASLAGLRGLPRSSGYSASKAAMQAFLEAARIELASFAIRVTVVNPGFVATPMTEKNEFRMPFLVPVDRAAKQIAGGIERGARVIEFPLPMSMATRIARVMPAWMYDRAVGVYAKRRVDAKKIRR
ncbi:MAG TPA: SDR family NAD(P)-dependent oxidoreductase [Thermoanaerobaculia bacterium]|nr:SDR family NAD(P)-dependent oxidoreductase [Thermoanaerobaculia bacterium]